MTKSEFIIAALSFLLGAVSMGMFCVWALDRKERKLRDNKPTGRDYFE
jgi:hypothetical protein